MTDVVGEFDENRIAHQHCGIGTQPCIENVILVHITSSPERKLSIAYCLQTWKLGLPKKTSDVKEQFWTDPGNKISKYKTTPALGNT